MSLSSDQTKNPSVCFVHDWLVAMRGGEKVLEAMVELFPEAPIYTLFVKRGDLSPILQKRKIYVSFLQYIPGIFRFYRWLLPIFPLAVRFLKVQKYRIVISSSHCVAKAVRVGKDSLHVCYCHTPMRYLWEFSEEYFGRFPSWVRWLIELYFKWLRTWDIKISQKVTAFIANSKNTGNKISIVYGKKATVINPPVDTPMEGSQNKEEVGKALYFLIVSALVPYKRIDIAIKAFNQLERPLKIVGDGPLRMQLEKLVRYHGIQFEGWLNQEALWNRYANCQALVFPGEEDFGIVPLEAQMFGKPVIAFGRGGVVETVLAYNENDKTRHLEQSTGLFFHEQTPRAIIEQVRALDHLQFNPMFIQGHAYRFGRKRFQKELAAFLETYSISTSCR